MKNYIGFVNDHFGSMSHLARAAMNDYNANIAAIKEAATQEMLDTVVSVVGVGYPNDHQVTRQVQISNPHVLKPVTKWAVQGGTPLYDGIASMINLLKDLPDANEPNVSFLVMITTDGEECSSRSYNKNSLTNLIAEVANNGRWTFVFRVPKGEKYRIADLGVPAGNIQEWETSVAGMEKATTATKQAVDTYFTARSTGSKSSTTFYADANKVDTSILTDISKEVSLYVVPDADMGIEMRPFILRHRMEYLKGAAFYQLTKTEARVSHTKLIAIRDRNTGHVYSGFDARKMIGLPTDKNARLHPGDHGNFDLFIQSESINRKLVGGTGVLYWPKIGVPFTDADLAYLQPKPATNSIGPLVLPKVEATGKPTKSPIPKKPKVTDPTVCGKPVQFFPTRREARSHIGSNGSGVKDVDTFAIADVVGTTFGQRWFVYL